MIKILHKIFSRFTGKEVVNFSARSYTTPELSDGDRAALYGWPDKTVKEACELTAEVM